jgi:hypothetical protein
VVHQDRQRATRDGAEAEKQDAFIKSSHPSSSLRRRDRFSTAQARVIDTKRSREQDENLEKIDSLPLVRYTKRCPHSER